MAYQFAGYEQQWCPQEYPAIYHGHYHSPSPQDEYWPAMEMSTDNLGQKFQPLHPSHPCLMPGQQFVHHSPPEMASLHEFNRSTRYVSPSGSHYSSHYSESSASTEHALTPSSMTQSMQYPSSSMGFPGQHSYGFQDTAVAQHVIWQSEPHESYTALHVHSTTPFLPSQHSLPMRELEMVQQHEDMDISLSFDHDLEPVHSKSPLQMPQPEELELSDAHTESSLSIANDNQCFTSPTEYDPRDQMSDDGMEEDDEDEQVIVDNESDPDYDNRPNRRRTSQTTPRAKHSRKPSNNTILSPSSRVHKRTSSASTVTATTPGSSARRTSKPTKPKPKGPTFVSKSVAVAKSDRVYPCTFHRMGCSQEFPNKNEWKRHVACQHLQLGYYRCDLGSCNPDIESSSTTSSSRPGRQGRRTPSSANIKSEPTCNDLLDSQTEEVVKIYNDFNRKDLFTQHCRRMHGPQRNPALCSSKPSNASGKKNSGTPHPTKEDEDAFELQLDEIRARCWHIRRPAPSRSTCGFCNALFDADYVGTSTTKNSSASQNKETAGAEEKAWEERMEHVGRHYEKEGRDRADEEPDEDLVEWGLANGVLRTLSDGRAWLVSAEDPTITEGQDHGAHDIASARDAGRAKLSGPIKFEEDEEEDSKDAGKLKKRARRQPSRTVVVQRRVSFKEEHDQDEDTSGESE